MSDDVNPYEAPKSELVSDIAASEGQTYFFTASPLKVVVMSVCTFGFYELYWFYKNWVLIKQRTGSDIMPVWRAIFAPFWGFSAFDEVNKAAAEYGVTSTLSAGWFGLLYLLLSLISNGPDPFWLISTFTVLALFPFNKLAISINQKAAPDIGDNSSFSPWNWLGIVVGGSLFVLTIIGTLSEELLDNILMLN